MKSALASQKKHEHDIQGSGCKNILVANNWSDKNKGDLAISLASIQILSQIAPDAKISAVSYFGANQIGLVNEESRLLRENADSILGNVLPTFIGENQRKAKQAIIEPLVIIWGILLLAYRPLLKHMLPLELQKTVRCYEKSNLIVIKGGSYVTASSFAYFFRAIYPALLAISLQKPYVFLGHTIWSVDSAPSRLIIKGVVKYAALVILRERLTARYLQELGAKGNVFVFPDLAFFLQLPSFQPIGNVPKNPTFGITVRYWPQNRESYLKTISELVVKLRNDLDANILLIAQVTGPTAVEDDTKEVQLLYQVLTSSPARSVCSKNIFLVARELPLNDLAEVYSSCDVVVGTRFHSVILSLNCRTPALAISYYSPKAEGIMESMGLAEYCLRFDQLSADQLTAKTLKLWNSRQDISDHISIELQKINHSKTNLIAVLSSILTPSS